jgi:hypothetical protein
MMKSFGDMMKQAQKVQKQMSELQEKLAEERYEASAGGGMVQVVVDGNRRSGSAELTCSGQRRHADRTGHDGDRRRWRLRRKMAASTRSSGGFKLLI